MKFIFSTFFHGINAQNGIFYCVTVCVSVYDVKIKEVKRGASLAKTDAKCAEKKFKVHQQILDEQKMNERQNGINVDEMFHIFRQQKNGQKEKWNKMLEERMREREKGVENERNEWISCRILRDHPTSDDIIHVSCDNETEKYVISAK